MHSRSRSRLAFAALSLCVPACSKAGTGQQAVHGSNPPGPTAPVAAKTPGPTDGDVLIAVKTELHRDKKIDESRVGVAVDKGIVSLTGRVDNLLSRARAVRIAESVRGVRSVSDRLEIVPTPRQDDAIARDVKKALHYDPATAKMPIQVMVSAGVVKLGGTVQSFQEKQLAERTTEGVQGVRKVQNDLQMREAAKRPDDAIVADVRGRLSWDILVANDPVGVAVKNGKLTLTGAVGSAAEEARAITDSWVDGVTSVDPTALEVRWWERPDQNLRANVTRSDANIAKAVKDAILYDPRVKYFDVVPHVSNGVVTLSGSVSTLKAKMAAEDLARNTVGVSTVKDNLAVLPSQDSDAALASRITAVLAFDPTLDAGSIKVDVTHGHAHLTGDVDTAFDSAEAFDDASGVLGVTAVKDDLGVRDPGMPYVYSAYLAPYIPYVDGWYIVPSKPTFADTQLKQRIESELKANPFIPPDEVQVSVADGRATLTGTVASARQRDTAGEDAFEAGAIAVNNELKLD